jgi:hypothetical protein
MPEIDRAVSIRRRVVRRVSEAARCGALALISPNSRRTAMTSHTASDEALPTQPVSGSFTRHLPTIARCLLGFVFFASGVFGLLLAFGLVPMPAQSAAQSDAATAFMVGLMKAGYLFPLLKVTELLAGAFLLANRCVPFALVLLAPVVVNIFAVHVCLMPEGLAVASVIVALEAYLGWAYLPPVVRAANARGMTARRPAAER